MIAHRVSQGQVVVTHRGHIAILRQRVMQVTIELLLDLDDVSNLSDRSHGNLLPAVGITAGHRHSLEQDETGDS